MTVPVERSAVRPAGRDDYPPRGRQRPAWRQFNLWRNPFGELTRQERVRLAVVDLETITASLNRPRSAVQLIGACGRGKTTRMLALAEQYAQSSYVYLPEDGGCPAIADGNPLLIDEAQRLPRRVRRMIFAVGSPLVLATHRDLSRSLRKHGYQVRNERIGDGNTPELVQQLLNRRIAASRLDGGWNHQLIGDPTSILRVTLADARRLVSRFGSNVRAIEGYLYERIQSELGDHGEMRFID